MFYALQMSLLIATLLQPQCSSNSERAWSGDSRSHCRFFLFCQTETKDMPLEVINGLCDTHTYNHKKTGPGLTGLGKHHPHTTTSTHTPSRSHTFQNEPLEATRPPPFLPPGPSFLPLTLCGLSCMLTVPKHDEPFSPMGISPPSKLASATSVSVRQSRCNGSSSSGGSSVAVAVTWLRRQPASQ